MINPNLLQNLLSLYPFKNPIPTSISNGLINHTWSINDTHNQNYIFQIINTNIFKNPKGIDNNINLITQYFKTRFPDYCFPTLLPSLKNKTLENIEDTYCRVYYSIPNTFTMQIPNNTEFAKFGAAKFAEFTNLLKDFSTHKLEITLPNFHNLELIQNKYLLAIQQNNRVRLQQAKSSIELLKQFEWIPSAYSSYINNRDTIIRVIHHDSKISNVLFNQQGAVAIIDLDTLMPGYIFSDLGDIIRTYTCTYDENYTGNVEINPTLLDAVIQGYTEPLKDNLTNFEKEHIYLSGYFLIYMQAIRFLADFLQNDLYYKIEHPMHNLDRAINQINLLNSYHQIVQYPQ